MKKSLVAALALVTVLAAGGAMAQMQPGNDHRHQIRIGIHKIDEAYNHLASAGDDWAGHRGAAMQHLQEAKHELEVALQFEEQQMGH